MRLVDPHVYMTYRTNEDYRAMAASGVVAVVEPAFWLGQPHTSAATFEDYFLCLVGWERFRAIQFGIRHYCALALNPKETNDPRVARNIMAILPRFLSKPAVVALGEVGYAEINRAEDIYLSEQIVLAEKFGLPIVVHTPHREKRRAIERTIAMLRDHRFPMKRVLIDHNTEETLPTVLDCGAWAGNSVHCHAKLSREQVVGLVRQFGGHQILINSAADWSRSDPLEVSKTAAAMLAAGIDRKTLDAVVWDNPLRFFEQSGRLDRVAIERAADRIERNRSPQSPISQTAHPAPAH